MDKIDNKIKEMNAILKCGADILKSFAKYQMVDEEKILDLTWKDLMNTLASWNYNLPEFQDKTFTNRIYERIMAGDKFIDFLEAAEKYNKVARSGNLIVKKYVDDLEDLKALAAKYSKANVQKVSRGFDLEKMTSL